MTASQGELAGLSKFIFRAPNWYTSVGFSLLIAALAGVASFDAGYVLEDAGQGVFFIGIPTVVAAVGTTTVDRWLGGQLTFNRSALLAFACEFVVVTFLVVAGAIAVLSPLDQHFVFDALIAALALVFAFRLLVVLAVSRYSPIAAAAPASIQTATAGVLLFIYSGTMNFLAIGGPLLNAYLSRPQEAPAELSYVFVPEDFLLLLGMSALYGLIAYGFLTVVDRPWKRSLDVSILDFVRGFIGHIAEGTHELEDFFERIGEEAVVPVTVLSFRRREETAADSGAQAANTDSEKARFVLPMIHPGPMGEIGGGNLPKRVAESAEGLAFPPHATAGHDFNLVTEREVETLIDAAETAHDRIEYGDRATRSVRAQEGEAKLLGQAFGDDALLVSTYSPEFADDVEYAVGLSAAAEARVSGMDDVLLVDAHNCNNGLEGEDLGHVYPGSKRSFDMIQAAGRAAEDLVAADDAPLELGTAWDPTPWRPEDGVGPLGIRVGVIDVAGQRTGYVLVDGNNMEPGLRERIVEEVQGLDAMEVMTTDTHVVNTVESTNQVGAAIDQAELIRLIQDLVDEATADLEPVEAGMATERAEVTVFGNDRTETLASHANAAITMGGALAATVVLATLAVSVLIFFLT